MEVDEAAGPSGGAHAAITPASPAAAEASSASLASVVLAPSGTTGSVSIALHPLVIMNISEHWTRTKAQAGGPQTVFGALIGQQRGREIELMNSFELAHHRLDGRDVIDREYYALKESQFKQVFSDMDFLGWYSTGEAPGPAEIDIQRQICEINESPLFLQLHPAARHTDLPVAIYESVVDLVGGQARLLFVPLTYSLQTEEAERIGLDHVARISGAVDDGHSQVDEHVMVQHSAIKMLASRVQVILRYVREVHAGALPFNHDVMREAKALADRLPVLESARFQPEFYTQCNDAALLTYLGTIMKSCNHLNQFIKKFNVLYQRQGGHGRRLRGMFF
ncbi:COP9 signalosome complex subunit 6-like [Tigriopus californicus]|nr:COP9 signalosome complex subunit 6-like [Tigriopus californicus]